MAHRAFSEVTKKLTQQTKRFYEKTIYIALSPYRLFKFICFSVGLITLLVGTFLSAYTYSFFHELPDFDKLGFESLKKLAVKRVEKKLENKKRFVRWVPLRNVSRDLVYSIVMSEDGHFFEHNGLNYDAILDSIAHNLKKREVVSGASTISQQVVKNLYFTNTKTISRKFKELITTRELERKFSKNKILEIYLNIAEFGPDIYGVHRAAYHFFGKSPKKINAAEGVFLALMLPSPRRNYYSIFQNKNLTYKKKKKIKRVLRDMLYQEFISPKQYRNYTRYHYFKKMRQPASH